MTALYLIKVCIISCTITLNMFVWRESIVSYRAHNDDTLTDASLKIFALYCSSRTHYFWCTYSRHRVAGRPCMCVCPCVHASSWCHCLEHTGALEPWTLRVVDGWNDNSAPRRRRTERHLCCLEVMHCGWQKKIQRNSKIWWKTNSLP